MKQKITLLITLLLMFSVSLSILAQEVPNAINFQAIARDVDGELMPDTAIQIRLTIIDGSETGTEIYQELRALTTNAYGAFSFQIGRDADYETIGSFEDIIWETGHKYLKIDYDPTNTFTWDLTLGTIEFVSVPYAFTAATVSYIDLTGIEDGDVLIYNAVTEKFEPGQIEAGSAAWDSITGTIPNVSTFPNDANYLTSYSETDPIFNAWDKNAGISITESQISDFGSYLSSEVDGSITNEIQTLSILGAELTINGGNTVTLPTGTTYTAGTGISIVGNEIVNTGDTDASDDFDGQYTNLTGAPTNVSSFTNDANYLTEEVDGSITNEIQTLSIDGNNLTITGDGGNTIALPASTGGNIQQVTRAELDALTPEVGETAYNTTDEVVLMWNGTNWIQISDNCFPQATRPHFSGHFIYTSETSVILDGNTPEEGTGEWSVIEGTGGSFADITDPTTTFTGNECTNYEIRWTITSACGVKNYSGVIRFRHTPTTANAGDDQTINTDVTTVSLNANTPEEGAGTWSVLGGTTGGTFADVSNPTTTFTGNSCTDYTLQWKVATNCLESTNTVNISFNATPTVAVAGDNIYSPSLTTVTLAANSPSVGTGVWSIVSGAGGTFSNPNAYNSNFTGNDNETYVLRWTITGCTTSEDYVTVFIGNTIGQYAHGGVIFYVDGTGDHGLVCDINDLSDDAEWGCSGIEITGADGTAIGTGAQNTIDIEAGCSETGTAADLCANLTLNSYSDWFLPSKDELNQMYLNKELINTIAVENGGVDFGHRYWSSSESDDDDVWSQYFSDGAQWSSSSKYTHRYVRAVRAF